MWFYARIFVRPVRADLFTGILCRVAQKERSAGAGANAPARGNRRIIHDGWAKIGEAWPFCDILFSISSWLVWTCNNGAVKFQSHGVIRCGRPRKELGN